MSGSSNERPSASTTWSDEAEIGIVGDERLDRLGLEAEEHPQRLRNDEQVGEGGAGEEQHQPDEERRDQRLLLPLVERRSEEGPDLPEDDRRREHQADDEAQLEDDHHRVGGAGHDQLAVGEVRRDRLLEDVDELKPLDQPEPQGGAATSAPSDRRMRNRSSSRWSRKGISPAGPVMKRAAPGLSARAPSVGHARARLRPIAGTSGPRADTRPWPWRCPSAARPGARGCRAPTPREATCG